MGATLSPQDLRPNGQAASKPGEILTYAAIDPHNSGELLLYLHDNVMGANTAIRSIIGKFFDIDFAIPSSALARIVLHLI